eukprot:SAG11_NODE_1089_length_5920_cov_12.988146_2_plen_659_part_00
MTPCDGRVADLAGPGQKGEGRQDDEHLWASITPEVNTLLSSPTVGESSPTSLAPRPDVYAAPRRRLLTSAVAARTGGALTSLLGPDLIGPPGNSLMHVAQPGDQRFHRDGTDHGPTMPSVRDHRCRHVIVMFYPVATTVDLGPTSILPRSQYTGVNREGFHNSEERLSPFMRPPTGSDALEPTAAWQERAAKDSEFTAAQSLEEQDATRIADAIELLGDPTLSELKVVVPAGGVVICHIDLWHRASRKTPEAKWRPMFAVRSVARVSDPAGPTARLWQSPVAGHDANAFAHVDAPAEHKAVWQEQYDYMCGRTGSAQGGGLEPMQLERQLVEHGEEMTRIGSGYELGMLARAAPGSASGAEALRALQRCLLDPEEATRRAAAYGLTVAGTAALPWLLRLLASPAALEALPSSEQRNVDVKQGVLVQVVHAVAHCAKDCSADLAAQAVGALCAAMRRAAEEIEAATVGAQPEELDAQRPWLHDMYQAEVPLNFRVVERRRTVAEGCVALGLIGSAAVRDGREGTASRACAALVAVASSPEPGLGWAAFMTRQSVIHNAALGLVRLTSDPTTSGAALPQLHTGGGWADEERREHFHGAAILKGMVQEAKRRGVARLGAGLAPSTAALEGVLRQIEEATWPQDAVNLPEENTSYLVLETTI